MALVARNFNVGHQDFQGIDIYSKYSKRTPLSYDYVNQIKHTKEGVFNDTFVSI